MKNFICIKKCFHNGRLFNVGDVLEAELANKHFSEKAPVVVELQDEPKTFRQIETERQELMKPKNIKK